MARSGDAGLSRPARPGGQGGAEPLFEQRRPRSVSAVDECRPAMARDGARHRGAGTHADGNCPGGDEPMMIKRLSDPTNVHSVEPGDFIKVDGELHEITAVEFVRKH